ncbi:MAG: hypothetical protein HYV03_03405 [Deltaproteobacteria bacterium]|nr:hypothetical protein [Deltaproteobacteria bacterium]
MATRGVSALAAVVTLLLLAIFGASIVAVVAEEQVIGASVVLREQAFYTAMSGLEWGLREVSEGGYPQVSNKAFAGGAFTTEFVSAARVVRVTATVGSAQRSYQITVPYLAGDCVTLDTSSSVPIGSKRDEINRVAIRKACLNKARIVQAQASWTPDSGQRLIRLDYDGDTVYDNATGVTSGTTVDIADVLVVNDSGHQFSRLLFSDGISETQMTLVIFFSDGSSTSTTWQVVSGGGG